MRNVTILLSVLIFLIFFINKANAAVVTVRTGLGGYVTKEVTSIREMRFKNVVPQKYDFSCGAAAVATILKYGFKIEDVHEEEIVKDMIENGNKELIKEKGFSLLDLKKYAERKGFSANGYKLAGEKLLDLKIPAIVLLNTKGYEHFVVLKSADKEKIYLADPAIGNRAIPFNEFLEAWNSIVFVVYKKTDRDIVMKHDASFRPDIANVITLKNTGIRSDIPLKGEF